MGGDSNHILKIAGQISWLEKPIKHQVRLEDVYTWIAKYPAPAGYNFEA